MATLYASAGVVRYWVVDRAGVWVHADPDTAAGLYRRRTLLGPDDRVDLDLTGTTIPVADLLVDAWPRGHEL